ncbi:Vacuolar protein sorting-associated protein 53 [Nowakowskiella sp. JEL0078]|nr:Vacuolar protein sorting-associated protein 53 [Nowakowskiella sp. JEL0078]
MVNFTAENDIFLNVAGLAVKSLVKGIENCVESSLVTASRKNWGNIQSVGDQSDYISMIASTLSSLILNVRMSIPESSSKYFRTFCDKFAESFLARYHGNIFKCKPISEVGAEQMLLDTHALKTILIQMINVGAQSPTPVPQMYIKVLNKAITKIEQLLKVIMNPFEPPEQLVDTYMVLFNDSNLANFVKIIELKVGGGGLKRVEQQALADVFQSRRTTLNSSEINPSPNLGIPITGSTNSVFGSPFMQRLQTPFNSFNSEENQKNVALINVISPTNSDSNSSISSQSLQAIVQNPGQPVQSKGKEDFSSFMLRKMNLGGKGQENK